MYKSLLCLFAILASLTLFSPITFAQDAPADTPAVTEEGADNEAVPAEEVSGAGALIKKLKQSGATGVALLLVSLFGCSIAFERLSNLKKEKIVPAGFAGKVDTLWGNDDHDGILNACKGSKTVLAKVVREIVEHRKADRIDISTMAGDVASREMRLQLQKAYPLAVVATISPLLGLFGTVYGMIGAFESVALAGQMGDPSIMAGDIAYALITTALGLVVAVPALACYHYFRIKTNTFALSLEEQASHLISRWYPVASEKKA